jgi:hypothetical protein
VPETALTVSQGHGTQIIAAELHEIERPKQQLVLGALIHAPMQLIEAIHVYELGIDDRRGARQRGEAGSEMGEAARPIRAVAGE